MVADRHTVPSRSPEVDDERVVVFFDGTDSVWGGCTDFEERYLRLERDTGDQSVSQSVSHYHTPSRGHLAHTLTLLTRVRVRRVTLDKGKYTGDQYQIYASHAAHAL